MIFSNGAPVRLETDDTGAPILRPLTIERLQDRLTQVATWVMLTKRGTDYVLVEKIPPRRIVQAMLARADLPLPPLHRIVGVPTFAADGTLLSQVRWVGEREVLPGCCRRAAA